MSPLGNLVVLGAHIAETAANPDATVGEKVLAPVSSIAKTVSEQSFMEGTRRFLEAFEGPEERQRLVESLSGSAVPNILRRFARFVDPVQRERDGPLDAIKGGIPGLSSTLPARIDPLGEEIRFNEGLLDNFIDPFYRRPDRVGRDRVRQEIDRLGVSITSRRKLKDETPEEFEFRRRVEGDVLGEALWDRMQQDDYAQATEAAEEYLGAVGISADADALADEVRKEMLEDEIRRVRAQLTREYREFREANGDAGRPGRIGLLDASVGPETPPAPDPDEVLLEQVNRLRAGVGDTLSQRVA